MADWRDVLWPSRVKWHWRGVTCESQTGWGAPMWIWSFTEPDWPNWNMILIGPETCMPPI